MSDEVKVPVDARAKSVREVLDGCKYRIDFYQREYRWGREHVTDLLDDLEDRFLGAYDPVHQRKDVREYPHYFLGSIIISRKDGHEYIIDGQQRLTSLTLLLIHLHHLQREQGIPEDERVEVRNMIESTVYAERSFNLEVPERRECMEALLRGQPFDETGKSESVRNIIARYQDIAERIGEVVKGEALLYFVDWVKERVHLVQITTYSDEEAYAIFETMNDRGLRLNHAEMLKGYLLTKIKDPDRRAEANELWKGRMLQFIGLGKEVGKEEELDFFKAWLRSQHADSIRARERGALNQDFEKIGSGFHKWVRDNEEQMGLLTEGDFHHFVTREFDRFADRYILLRRAGQELTAGLEEVYFNAYMNLTLQYPLLLAPLRIDDDPGTADRKMRVVATFIDIFAARRIVNSRTLRYSSIVYTMFNLMKKIRRLDVSALADVLKAEVLQIEETFEGVRELRLHQQNRRAVHWLLARITQHIEAQSGVESSFQAYVSRHIQKPFEIEHIWANRHDRHSDEFQSETEFLEYRDRVGGLVLLPRGFNQSYGDLPYEDKRPHYLQQNLLARTLHEQCYERNPSFKRYVERSGLPFKHHSEFKKADLDARQELYRRICEEVWTPDRLDHAATS